MLLKSGKYFDRLLEVDGPGLPMFDDVHSSYKPVYWDSDKTSVLQLLVEDEEATEYERLRSLNVVKTDRNSQHLLEGKGILTGSCQSSIPDCALLCFTSAGRLMLFTRKVLFSSIKLDLFELKNMYGNCTQYNRLVSGLDHHFQTRWFLFIFIRKPASGSKD